MGTIYTAGYGNIAVDEFLNLLKQNEIEMLIDIRSQPYSQNRPEYRKKSLEKLARKERSEELV